MTVDDAVRERRRLALAEYFLIYEDTDDDSDTLVMELTQRRDELREQYLDTLVDIAVARCPFTGEVVTWRVDVVDIDGLFWDARNPARLAPAAAPPTFVGLSGALRLGDVPWAPFLSRPGPEVPFLVPQALEPADVRAVVSSLAIGSHMGFPIAYFADPKVLPLMQSFPRVNEWGTDRYWVQDASGAWRWGESAEDEASYDYDLARWIDGRRLSWIAPGDASLTLRTTVDDCPYLDLPGHRSVTRVEEGDAWWPEDVGELDSRPG
ncbi:MAG TPA: hypothetical protein VHN98_07445 [Acidimicrobiales bacterium]|nr:hypothetical protein [Acidimicrobiales bacterium]